MRCVVALAFCRNSPAYLPCEEFTARFFGGGDLVLSGSYGRPSDVRSPPLSMKGQLSPSIEKPRALFQRTVPYRSLFSLCRTSRKRHLGLRYKLGRMLSTQTFLTMALPTCLLLPQLTKYCNYLLVDSPCLQDRSLQNFS